MGLFKLKNDNWTGYASLSHQLHVPKQALSKGYIYTVQNKESLLNG